MFVDFPKNLGKFNRIAIAVSGGTDSMALLHYAFSNANSLGAEIFCLNIEHGIRGESSKNDSKFVKNYCEKNNIPLIFYEVDAPKLASLENLSLEESARTLRYSCFFDAIYSGKCDMVATAHHQKDNAESILLNLFRGTSLKGLTGISDYNNKIIRPFLNLSKQEIEDYVVKNNIPFVVDESNLSKEYSRNFLRLEILPKIEKLFPKYQSSLKRLSALVKKEDDYLDMLATEIITSEDGIFKIDASANEVLIKRASIIALKKLGIEKDWESVHVESIYNLASNTNGKSVNLPKDIVATREYDFIVLYKNKPKSKLALPFKTGEFRFLGKSYSINAVSTNNINLKDGLYIDADKIPEDAVIRTILEGDKFTKFGGGTKPLAEFFTDKKIPLRNRQEIPLLCKGETVLAVFGIAISELVRVDENTKNIININ